MLICKTLKIYPKIGNTKPIQVWIPISINSYIRSEVKVDGKLIDLKPSVGNSEINIFTMLYFNIEKVKKVACLKVWFEYPKKVEINIPVTPYFLDLGLKSELYVNYDNKEIDMLISKILGKEKVLNNKLLVKKVKAFLNTNLKYEYSPKTRIASEVAKSLSSDCGGYHSLFCAILRKRGIHSQLCFGFRGDKSDKYHTTSVWFDGKKWIREDINDLQDNNGIVRPFIPITIGSGIDISTKHTPKFPKFVYHLQHSLVWIEGEKPLNIKGTFKIIQK